MIRVTITEKGGEPKVYSFDRDELSIGRVSGNDIVLPKGNVSKRHAKLQARGDRLEITDLQSTNGTYVNGRKITEATGVGEGDKIYIGDFLMVLDGSAVTSAGEAEASSAPRRLPVPPPPPIPGGQTGPGLASGVGHETGVDIEDEEGLAALATRPPSALRGRPPIPPPPPPSRRATPNMGVGPDDSLDLASGAVSASDAGLVGDAGPEPNVFSRPPSDVSGEIDSGGRGVPAAANDSLLSGPSFSESPAGAPTAADAGYGLGPVAPEASMGGALATLLADTTVSAVFINGSEAVLVERAGVLEAQPSLGDTNAVADALWRLANTAVPPPAPDNPVVDVRLLDGTRLTAVFPPVAPAGMCAAIRRAVIVPRGLQDLGGPAGPPPEEVQAVIDAAIAGQRNLVVSGDALALAALLGAIAGGIPGDRRVVTIGAAAGQGRPKWTDLAPTADPAALIRVASTFRAEHLMVGEIVGPELLELLLAATRGQDGVVVALPARSASEAAARIEALASQSAGATGVASLAASALDLVVHAATVADGGCRITEVSELRVDGAGRLATDPVVTVRESGKRGGTTGKLQVSGLSPRLAEGLAAAGVAVPPNLVRK